MSAHEGFCGGHCFGAISKSGGLLSRLFQVGDILYDEIILDVDTRGTLKKPARVFSTAMVQNT